MGEAYPNAANEEPQHIHKYAQAARLRLFPIHLRAEWPDGKYAHFHALHAEWNADDCYHQNQTTAEILNGYM